MAIQGIGGIGGKGSSPRRTKQYQSPRGFAPRQPYNREPYERPFRPSGYGADIQTAANYPLQTMGYLLGNMLGNYKARNDENRMNRAMAELNNRIAAAQGMSNEYADADEFIGLNRPQSTMISADPVTGVQISTPKDRAKELVVNSKLDAYNELGDNPSQARAQIGKIDDLARQYSQQSIYDMDENSRNNFIRQQIDSLGTKLRESEKNKLYDKYMVQFADQSNRQAKSDAIRTVYSELPKFYSGQYTPEQYMQKVGPTFNKLLNGGHFEEAMALMNPYVEYTKQQQSVANEIYKRKALIDAGLASPPSSGRVSSGGTVGTSSRGGRKTVADVDPWDAEVDAQIKDITARIKTLDLAGKKEKGTEELDANDESNSPLLEEKKKLQNKLGTLIKMKNKRDEDRIEINSNGYGRDGNSSYQQIGYTVDAMDREMMRQRVPADERRARIKKYIDGNAEAWKTNPDMLFENLYGEDGYVQRQRRAGM